MSLLAIDPGTTVSGWVVLDQGNKVTAHGISSNEEVLRMVYGYSEDWDEEELAIEMAEGRGSIAGREVFETILWTGRFMEAYPEPERVSLVYRRTVKQHLCGSKAAKDTNIMHALLDLLGPKGTKADPGPCYGIAKHMWAALGVAVTVRGITPAATQ